MGRVNGDRVQSVILRYAEGSGCIADRGQVLRSTSG
jgi:hypothetical protein